MEQTKFRHKTLLTLCLLTKKIQGDTLTPMKAKDYYTPGEVAKITGLTLRTIYKWIKRGDFHTLQKTKKCKHLIPAYELPTFLRKKNKYEI